MKNFVCEHIKSKVGEGVVLIAKVKAKSSKEEAFFSLVLKRGKLAK